MHSPAGGTGRRCPPHGAVVACLQSVDRHTLGAEVDWHGLYRHGVEREGSGTLESYGQPRLIATYSIEELLADAAIAITSEPSDEVLKRELKRIDRPLERLGAIGTVEHPE